MKTKKQYIIRVTNHNNTSFFTEQGVVKNITNFGECNPPMLFSDLQDAQEYVRLHKNVFRKKDTMNFMVLENFKKMYGVVYTPSKSSITTKTKTKEINATTPQPTQTITAVGPVIPEPDGEKGTIKNDGKIAELIDNQRFESEWVCELLASLNNLLELNNRLEAIATNAAKSNSHAVGSLNDLNHAIEFLMFDKEKSVAAVETLHKYRIQRRKAKNTLLIAEQLKTLFTDEFIENAQAVCQTISSLAESTYSLRRSEDDIQQFFK